MGIVRSYYLRKMVLSKFRRSGKTWMHTYYSLGYYYGWRWLFFSKRKKSHLVNLMHCGYESR